MKLIFRGYCQPGTVKVDLARQPVRPSVPRPLQSKNCFKMGHVAGACTSQTKEVVVVLTIKMNTAPDPLSLMLTVLVDMKQR